MTAPSPSRVARPDAWNRAPIPVIVGFAPPDTVRFDDLADVEVLRQRLEEPAKDGGSDPARLRTASLTLIHRCLQVLEVVLTAPLVLDGVALEVRATELGFRMRNHEPTAIWVGSVRAAMAVDPAFHLGAEAFTLLVPIVAAIRGVVRLPSRAVDNLMLDALAAGYRRAARLARVEPDAAFVHRLMAGAGRPDHRVARPLEVCPDGGSTVTFHVPRTCCVLATTATEASCPTCPQWADDTARRHAILAWVGAMDEVDFRATTGRGRMSATGRPTGSTPQTGAAG